MPKAVRLEIKENVSLAPYTTYKVGGPARYFATVTLIDELTHALTWAKEKKQPVFILGGGSNTLISDEGWPGLALEIQLRGVRAKKIDGSEKISDMVELSAAAGEAWDGLVRRAVTEGWTGIECLSGIPGSVGGALVQNIGAYGQTLQDVVVSCRCVEVATGQEHIFMQADCGFGYRDSRFKTRDAGKYLITEITLRLQGGNSTAPKNAVLTKTPYKDHRFNLGKIFEGRTTPPTLSEVRDAILDIREKKGMVMLPGRFSLQSAGSIFKNPMVTKSEFEKIMHAADQDPEKKKKLMPWYWEQPDGRVKISAAFLLEYTPFSKGFVRGAVGVSPRHSLSLITLKPTAKAAELATLAQDMQQAVKDIFGLVLEPEIKLVGFSSYPLLK